FLPLSTATALRFSRLRHASRFFHYAALTHQIAAFFDDLRLIFAANYGGVHEKRRALEKIEDAFESLCAAVTVMEEVRRQPVDEVVAVINDGDGEVKVLN
nr:hypothetical protein [Tanacetum cinerariifolium]